MGRKKAPYPIHALVFNELNTCQLFVLNTRGDILRKIDNVRDITPAKIRKIIKVDDINKPSITEDSDIVDTQECLCDYFFNDSSNLSDEMLDIDSLSFDD